jgi:hypothetical protein
VSSQTIDYDKLAQQYGGQSTKPAVDYDELAKKHGAIASAPAATPSTDAGEAPYDPNTATLWEKTKHGVSEFGAQLNPVTAVKGMAELAAHPIDTLAKDSAARERIYAKAGDKYAKGEYASGLAHGIYASLPLVGPNLDRSADQFESGDVAGGIGSSLGQGVAMAAPAAAKGMRAKLPGAGVIAEKLYRSTLKPSGTTVEAARVTQTGLDAGIPVSENGLKTLRENIDNLNKTITAEIDAGANKGAVVQPKLVAARTNGLKAAFRDQVTPNADLSAIDAAKKEFLQNNKGPIPANEAQAMKEGTYKQLRGKYGELSSARIEAEKALARGIKEELQTQFPEIKGLNSQEGQLINLDHALDKAVARIAKRNMVSLGGKLASAGAGTVFGYEGGHAAAGAITGLVLHEALSNPAVQSSLAIALYRASKGSLSMSAASARAAGYAALVGNAVNAQAGGDPTTQ